MCLMLKCKMPLSEEIKQTVPLNMQQRTASVFFSILLLALYKIEHSSLIIQRYVWLSSALSVACSTYVPFNEGYCKCAMLTLRLVCYRSPGRLDVAPRCSCSVLTPSIPTLSAQLWKTVIAACGYASF